MASAAPPSPTRDPAEARLLRERLVDVVAYEVRDPRVLDAIARVPRHLFAPGYSLGDCYGDHPLAIGHGATISQPTVVGLMSEALRLTGDERILEIGAGSGYQAAVLAALAREIHTVEIVSELAERAAKTVAELGFDNVHVHCGDGFLGWEAGAPYDRVVVTAAPSAIPQTLVDQLAEGGVLVVPVGPQTRDQRLERLTKRGGRLEVEDLGGVRFVPMVHGPAPRGESG